MRVTKKQIIDELIAIPEYKKIDYLIKEGNKEAKRCDWNIQIRLDNNTYYCTNCETEYHDKKIKIGERKKCPVCKIKSEVHRKTANPGCFEALLALTHVNKRNELIMRTFDFKKRFDKATRTFSYEVFEIYRYNIDRNIFVKKNVKVNFWYIYYIFDPKDKWRVTQRSSSWAKDVRLTGKIIGSSKKKNISKTKYKYACLLEASKIWDLRQYIEVYEMFPEIEIILKMGMREYFKDLMRFMEIRDVENVRKFLKENKRYYKIWSKVNPRSAEMQMMVDLDTYDYKFAKDALTVRYRKRQNIYASDRKVVNYLKKQGQDFSFWLDYVDFIQRLGISLDKNRLFPKDLKTEHDKMSKNLKILNDEAYEDDIAEFEEMLRPYNLENKRYLIRCAKTIDELKDESNQMNHCVRNYIPKIAHHKSAVFFLREQSEKEKSLVTIEIDPVDKVLLQARRKGNAEPTSEQMSFINEWCTRRMIDNSALTYTV